MVVLQHTVLKRFEEILLARHLAYEGLGDAAYALSLAKSTAISAPEGFVKTKGVGPGVGWSTFICLSLIPKSIHRASGRKSKPNRSGEECIVSRTPSIRLHFVS